MSEYGRVRSGYCPENQGWHAVEDCLPNYNNELDRDGQPRTGDSLYYRSPSVLLWVDKRARTGFLQWHYSEPTKPYRWFLDGTEGYLALGVTHWRWLPTPPAP